MWIEEEMSQASKNRTGTGQERQTPPGTRRGGPEQPGAAETLRVAPTFLSPALLLPSAEEFLRTMIPSYVTFPCHFPVMCDVPAAFSFLIPKQRIS